MILSERLINRLNLACRRNVLQDPLNQFLAFWTQPRVSRADCYNALHWMCRQLDAHGEYHAAEEVMQAGIFILDSEPERRAVARRTNNLLLAVGGVVVIGLLGRALARR